MLPIAETEDRGGKWRKAIFIIVGIFLVICLLIGLLVGLSSLRTFFLVIFIIVLICGILFGLGYLFYILFIQKTYIDIPADYKAKLMRVAKLMKNNMLGNLYLTGDSKHNSINLGKYSYLRLQLPKTTETVIEKQSTDPFNQSKFEKKVIEKTTPVEVDLFIVYKDKFTEKLFSSAIFIMVKPSDHNFSHIFADTYLKGFNIVPIDDIFNTINSRNLDLDLSKGVANSYFKEVTYSIFKELDRMMKQAMNLDQRFQKDKEKQSLVELPNFMGGGGKG